MQIYSVEQATFNGLAGKSGMAKAPRRNVQCPPTRRAAAPMRSGLCQARVRMSAAPAIMPPVIDVADRTLP
ncbi:hypothetical protein GGR61_004175 [Xanthomonas arboricola]|nr:hypothetical protein [Xanthomonas sp. 3058]